MEEKSRIAGITTSFWYNFLENRPTKNDYYLFQLFLWRVGLPKICTVLVSSVESMEYAVSSYTSDTDIEAFEIYWTKVPKLEN